MREETGARLVDDAAPVLPRPAGRRWVRRSVKAIVVLAAAALFLPFAYERIATPPAIPVDPANIAQPIEPPQPDDCAQEIEDLLASLPALPTVPPPGPASLAQGTGYALELWSVITGPWHSLDRPELVVAAEYLDSASVQNVLDALDGLRPRPFRLDPWWGAGLPAHVDAMELRLLMPLLAADARCTLERSGDDERALKRIRTLSWLQAQGPANDGNPVHGLYAEWSYPYAAQQVMLVEALSLVHRRPLTAKQRSAVAALVGGPEFDRQWANYITMTRLRIQQFIDASFTQDADGDGWLVLSSQTNPTYAALSGYAGIPGGGWPAQAQRSRLWNLCSPIFNNRRTVEAKRDRWVETLEEIGALPYAEATRRLIRLQRQDESTFNVLDGSCLAGGFGPRRWDTQLRRDYTLIRTNLAARDGVYIMLALQAYREVHECYPDRLADLVPAFLPEVPVDSFSSEPYRYLHAESGDYVLYSVGPDRMDGGGVPGEADRSGWLPLYVRHGDLCLSSPRP